MWLCNFFLNLIIQLQRNKCFSKVDRPENTSIICTQYNWLICTHTSLSDRKFEIWNHRNDRTNPSRAQRPRFSILSDTDPDQNQIDLISISTNPDQNHKLKVLFVWLERWAVFYLFRLDFMTVFLMGFCQGIFSSVLRRVTTLIKSNCQTTEKEARANASTNTASAFRTPYIMIQTEMETNFDFPTYVQSCNSENVLKWKALAGIEGRRREYLASDARPLQGAANAQNESPVITYSSACPSKPLCSAAVFLCEYLKNHHTP